MLLATESGVSRPKVRECASASSGISQSTHTHSLSEYSTEKKTVVMEERETKGRGKRDRGQKEESGN
jgi:hypothetical protein